MDSWKLPSELHLAESMPRKAFIADLQKAVGGVVITGISGVQPGNDDGEFTFFVKSATNGGTLELSALIPGKCSLYKEPCEMATSQ